MERHNLSVARFATILVHVRFLHDGADFEFAVRCPMEVAKVRNAAGGPGGSFQVRHDRPQRVGVRGHGDAYFGRSVGIATAGRAAATSVSHCACVVSLVLAGWWRLLLVKK